jgi:hypothetical protein
VLGTATAHSCLRDGSIPSTATMGSLPSRNVSSEASSLGERCLGVTPHDRCGHCFFAHPAVAALHAQQLVRLQSGPLHGPVAVGTALSS